MRWVAAGSGAHIKDNVCATRRESDFHVGKRQPLSVAYDSIDVRTTGRRTIKRCFEADQQKCGRNPYQFTHTFILLKKGLA
jgi:hypothetical protein